MSGHYPSSDSVFQKARNQLYEIQLDTLTKLLKFLQAKKLSPKCCWNIMNTLRACLHFAYDSIRIERMPSFPKKGQFKLCAPDPQWVDEATQLDIISNIPKEHHPISSLAMAYLFLPTICKSLPH